MHDKATIWSEGSPNFRGIGACGDDCLHCLRYKATMRDDPAELRRIRDLWISFGWRGPDTGPSEMACRGCRKENRCAYESLRNCAFGKGLANCGRCAEYPCVHVTEAFARTEDLFQTCRFDCAPEDRDGHANLPRFACTLAGRGYHIVLYCEPCRESRFPRSGEKNPYHPGERS